VGLTVGGGRRWRRSETCRGPQQLGSDGDATGNEEGGEGKSSADEKERDSEGGKQDGGRHLLNGLGARQRRKRGAQGGPGGRDAAMAGSGPAAARAGGMTCSHNQAAPSR
jgi:hypothetical protein